MRTFVQQHPVIKLIMRDMLTSGSKSTTFPPVSMFISLVKSRILRSKFERRVFSYKANWKIFLNKFLKRTSHQGHILHKKYLITNWNERPFSHSISPFICSVNELVNCSISLHLFNLSVV